MSYAQAQVERRRQARLWPPPLALGVGLVAGTGALVAAGASCLVIGTMSPGGASSTPPTWLIGTLVGSGALSGHAGRVLLVRLGRRIIQLAPQRARSIEGRGFCDA